MAGDPSSAAPATQRRRLSLGPSLIAALVLSALLPALLVSWLLSSNSSQAIDTLAENAISQAAHRVDVGALAHLGESHTVVNALVPPVTTSGAEAERTRNWLHDTAAFELMAYALTQQSPNVPYLYFGTTDGSFFGLEREEGRFVVREILPGDSGRRHYEITEPGDRSRLIKTETTVYDPRKRPWYQLAASTGKRVFTDVYRSAVKNQFDLTLAQPIFDADSKTLLGVMAVDMSLARLTDLIRSTRISDHAVTYLVDGQGRMVASSVDEDLSTLVNDKHQRITPLQSREALVRESYAQLFAPDRQASKGEQGLVRLETGSDWLQRLGLTSNRLIALHRPFGSKYQLDWQLVVVAPEQDFTAHVLQARQWALLAMAALIGFGALVAFLVARRLSAQFRRLNKAATLVGTGSVPPVQENAPFREVYNLSRVMHDSAAKLQAYNRAVKRKNKALREATLLLEERVRVRTAELATSREEALAAVKAKAGFLAVMSHEIRTPLNGVVGMSQLLGDTGLNRSQKELLGVLKVSSEQLLSVVDDILDFSKIESGKLSLEHLPMDLHAAIRGVCDIARLKSQEKGLQLRVDLRPDLPQAIVSDITRLRQVLLNLLSNAVKFTHHGDVTLRAWVEQAGDFDDAVADRRVHSGDVHERHRWPSAARVCRHDLRSDPGVGPGVVDLDADAVQPLCALPSRRKARHAVQSVRERLQRRAQGVRRLAQMGAAPQAFCVGGFCGHLRSECLALHAGLQGLPPRRGHRPADRVYRRRAGRIVRGHGRPADPGRRDRGARPGRVGRQLVGGCRWPACDFQQRHALHPPETEQGAQVQAGRNHRAPARQARGGAGDSRVIAKSPADPYRRAIDGRAVPVHPARLRPA